MSSNSTTGGTGLKRGTVARLSESQLRALEMGAAPPPAREGKRPKKDDSDEISRVYQEVEREFQGNPHSAGANRSWIRGGTVQHTAKGTMKQEAQADSKVYKPANKFEPPPPVKNEPPKPSLVKKPALKKGDTKKKSNLESFKEELMAMQNERDARRKSRLFGSEKPSSNRGDSHHHSSSSHQPTSITSKSHDVTPSHSSAPSFNPAAAAPPVILNQYGGEVYSGDDPTSNNLYLANLSSKMGERSLCQLFGQYGPLASVKIMWPRGEDAERYRNKNNCAFVAFMCRIDAERALEALNGISVLGVQMSLGWGKVVPVPPTPAYIPPSLLEYVKPAPSSGLPFNAQPNKPRDPSEPLPKPGTPEFDALLVDSTVRVITPSDRHTLQHIHRTIEFVVREGPMFEALLMNRELHNPDFRFLFDNTLPEHVYYRWRLFSVLQGDQLLRWRDLPFRMFNDGPAWRPPPRNPYTEGMAPELVPQFPVLPRSDGTYKSSDLRDPNSQSADDADDKGSQKDNNGRVRSSDSDLNRHSRTGSGRSSRHASKSTRQLAADAAARRGELTEKHRKVLWKMLAMLTPDRATISDAMFWCMEHAEAAHEICERLADYVCGAQTFEPAIKSVLPPDPSDTIPADVPIAKKVAILYLFSDMLHNSGHVGQVRYAARFRINVQPVLPRVMAALRDASTRDPETSGGRLTEDAVRNRVRNCCRSWADSHIFPSETVIHLQNIFHGLAEPSQSGSGLASENANEQDVDDVDGMPISNVDGIPIGKSADTGVKLPEPTGPLVQGYSDDEEEDVDGAPVVSHGLNHSRTSSGASLPSNHNFAPGNQNNPFASQNPPPPPTTVSPSAMFKKSKWETVPAVEATSFTSALVAATTGQPIEKPKVASKWDDNDDEYEHETENQGDRQSGPRESDEYDEDDDDDADGVPIGDDDKPMLFAASSDSPNAHQTEDEDVDGEPLSTSMAITVDVPAPTKPLLPTDERYMEQSERRRKRLREIEVKVLRYQDDLESGRRSRGNDSIGEMVRQYRQKLLNELGNSPSSSRHTEDADVSPPLDSRPSRGSEPSSTRSSGSSSSKSHRSKERSSSRRSRSPVVRNPQRRSRTPPPRRRSRSPWKPPNRRR